MTFSMLKAVLVGGLLSLSTTTQAQHLDSVAPERFFNERMLAQINYGLVCPAGTATKLPAPGTHLGFITQRDQSQFIEHQTQIIPLTKGIGFGVDAKVLGDIDLRGVEVTVLHPPYAGTDVTEESWQTDIVRDASNLNFFLFEFPFEMVAGEWAIQASHRGQIVYSVSFKVVDPARIPNLASYCSGSLLS